MTPAIENAVLDRVAHHLSVLIHNGPKWAFIKPRGQCAAMFPVCPEWKPRAPLEMMLTWPRCLRMMQTFPDGIAYWNGADWCATPPKGWTPSQWLLGEALTF